MNDVFSWILASIGFFFPLIFGCVCQHDTCECILDLFAACKLPLPVLSPAPDTLGRPQQPLP